MSLRVFKYLIQISTFDVSILFVLNANRTIFHAIIICCVDRYNWIIFSYENRQRQNHNLIKQLDVLCTFGTYANDHNLSEQFYYNSTNDLEAASQLSMHFNLIMKMFMLCSTLPRNYSSHQLHLCKQPIMRKINHPNTKD